jgi:hypothetical protein
MKWYSDRFGKQVYITHHAMQRAEARNIPLNTLQDLIETGQEKWKDQSHGWIHKFYPERNDNLICAAVQKKDAIIIKTIMHHWEEAPE